MKKLLTLFAILLIALTSAATSPGTTALRRSADKIKGAESLYVTYTATADGHKSEGLLVLQGNMFTISSPEMKSWFDGKTQWTYAAQIGEVNIITPTADEIRQINPLEIIKSFSTSYTAKPVKSQAGTSTVQLTSKDTDADIRSATVTIDDKTLYPTRIVLDMSNSQKVTIDIKNVNTGTKMPASNFRFDKNRYPGINVVDLR